MEVYTTENEQVDVIRHFLAENGKALVFGVVLGMGALMGWRYWQNHQATTLAEASAVYQQATEALVANTPTAVASAEKFIQGKHDNYSAFAALQLADHFAEAKDFANAEKNLVQALSLTQDDNLLPLVSLRLARVQWQQNKLDEALKTLDSVKGDGWSALVQNVRGDVLTQKGDVKGAKDAYNKSLNSNASQALQVLLRMKLNNLAG